MTATKNRLVQLDILRGVAILLVLGAHIPINPIRAGSAGPLIELMGRYGWTGVDLFFVLSGYLVGGLLMVELRDTGRIAPGRFLVRRAFKIWPGYFALLAVVCVFEAWKLTGALTTESLAGVVRSHWPSLLHVQNYQFETMRRVPHTWSLAVEEHFYLALPFVLIGLSRWRFSIPALAGLLLVVCAFSRHLAISGPFDDQAHYMPTHLRIDSLFLGVALAHLAHFHPARFRALTRYRRLLLFVGLALILPIGAFSMYKTPRMLVLGITSLGLGYACLVALAVSTEPGVGRLGRLMETGPARALAWVGISSYPIYLWHFNLGTMPVVRITDLWPLADTSGPALVLVTAALYLAFAIVPATVIGRLIDRPALLLRDRLLPAGGRLALRREPAIVALLPSPATQPG